MSHRNFDQLVAGLVGGKHHDLYRNSATFHAQIEVASHMLPIVVDALAVAAVEEEKRIADMIRISESMACPRLFISAEDDARWKGLANPLVDP